MEKFRKLIEPEEFTVLKVTKTSLEFVRFEAEIDNKNKLQYVIDRLNNKMIKLKEFSELMHVRAAEAKSDFPSRHIWDAFFRESNDMNEMKPGERPDTVHISNLPSKWFVHPYLIDSGEVIPSEKIFYRVFEKFGRIRHIDIPICDPYRKNMKAHMTGMQVSSFDENEFFEGYVQFKDYIGFSKTMDAFRNMKLLRKDNDDCITVNIKVDFDKTKHLSDASIRRREIVRERLVAKMKEKELREEKERKNREEQTRLERQREEAEKVEKEKRRQERERKRKQKILAKLKINGADEITNKIAKEEKKLLKAQRKLEAIRLVEELFRRIKVKYEETKPSRQSRMEEGNSELNKYKSTFESEVRQQRDRLHKAIEGRVILKSILSGGPSLRSTSSESLSSDSSLKRKKEKGPTLQQPPVGIQTPEVPYPYPEWMRYQDGILPNPYAVGGYYPPTIRTPMHGYLPYQIRGRKILRDMAGPSRGFSVGGPFPRRSRGYNFRNRGAKQRKNLYQLAQEEEYVKYFQKFLHEHDDRYHRDYSRSKSRSRSYSRSPSRRRSRSFSRRTRSNSKRRSYSRSRRSGSRRSFSRRRRSSSASRRSPSYSRRSHSSTKRRSGSRKSRSSYRKRSPSYSRRSKSTSRKRSYSKRSRSKDSEKSRKSSVSRTPQTQRNRSKSNEVAHEEKQCSSKNKENELEEKRSCSVDSSKFISPRSMRKIRSRSKSWSMPREAENETRMRSWSQSPVNKD
ncbi:trichohyalin isoform X2 [Agrilus planipennis]|nr:trichohyalin isoform X2 [Agrilus planipennis]